MSALDVASWKYWRDRSLVFERRIDALCELVANRLGADKVTTAESAHDALIRALDVAEAECRTLRNAAVSADERSEQDTSDATRGRWLLSHLRVEHDPDSRFTCWLVLDCIPLRYGPNKDNARELLDELIARFPVAPESIPFFAPACECKPAGASFKRDADGKLACYCLWCGTRGKL